VPDAVGWWNGLPKGTTRLFATISLGVSHALFASCGTELSRSTPGSSFSAQTTTIHPIPVRPHPHRWHQARSALRGSASSLVASFESMGSRYCVTHQRSARAHANCCALHTPSESLLGVPLDRQLALDVPGFASDTLGRDISASRWEHDHCTPAHHCRSGDTEP
jgi:hypothetical protein